MNKQKIGILIAAGIGMLTTFMPWFNAPFVGAVNGTEFEGWITLALFAVPAVACLINDKTKPLTNMFLYGAIAPAIIASVIGIWKLIAFKSKMAEMGDMSDNPFAEAMSSSVSLGFGLYLLILAGIAIPVIAFLVKDKEVTE